MTSLNLERDAAAGIHRIEDAHTNWYIVEDGERLLIVDTGFPRSWGSLQLALRALGRSPDQVDAVVQTHAHFDHMGFTRRAQAELGVPVWAHEDELSLVRDPLHYDHERSRLPYIRHPKHAMILSEMTAMGALFVKGTSSANTYASGDLLDVPGRPKVIPTPGHTYGHCALLFADRGAVIAGDAFVMLDPYTGRTGPCIVAGAATADSARALGSLDALAGLDADVALTGHGPAWHGSLTDAVERAKEAGPA